jgi:fatty acid-binding protein DegV
MAKYQIFSDSSCDLSTELRKANGLEYFYFGLVVDGVEYRADLDWNDYSPEEFYGWLSQGKKIKTTQVSMEEVLTRVRPYFEKGIDVIYIGCSGKLTGSMNLFTLALRSRLCLHAIATFIACASPTVVCLPLTVIVMAFLSNSSISCER